MQHIPFEEVDWVQVARELGIHISAFGDIVITRYSDTQCNALAEHLAERSRAEDHLNISDYLDEMVYSGEITCTDKAKIKLYTNRLLN